MRRSATLRCRGITFALFVQSFADLDKVYGPTAARIISDNCSYKILLGCSDPINQKYFSDAIGTVESSQKGIGVNINPFSGIVASFDINVNETRESIMYPQEFLTMKDVVFLNPHNSFCRLEKVLFYEHEEMFLNQSLQNHEIHNLKRRVRFP